MTENLRDEVAGVLAEHVGKCRRLGLPCAAVKARDEWCWSCDLTATMTDALMPLLERRELEAVREGLTGALHPEFGTEWREPDGIIYQAVQQALTERRPSDD